MVIANQQPLLSAKIDYPLASFRLQAEFDIGQRGITALFGRSGSGKSSLLRVLAGLTKDSRSDIRFNGRVWQDKHAFLASHKRHIGFVCQQPQLLPHLNVRANISFAYQRRFNQHGPSLDELSQWLGLSQLLDKWPQQLSGGQQQRVAIARSLACHPDLLLMDEPLSALDVDSREEILHHLEQLHRKLPTPIIYVSHNVEEIHRLADEVIVLDNGQIRQRGSLLELANQLHSPLHGDQHSTLLEASVSHYDPRWQLTTVTLADKQKLQLAGQPGMIGSPLRIRIPARDVSLTLSKADDTSILNCLRATIHHIENDAGAGALIQMHIGQGKQPLLAKLTQKSVHQLQLTVGCQVIAQIKGVAMLSDQPSKTTT
ncbi:molybdate transport system ATP-binding protein [Sinobacterium caligoides]|uniref:Molybdate transport system ATP-binding protein n=1 Tax=Sinobacterium caligoides TaxID=933926 RepID=A0A3N2DQQ4_9GAMM|nr:molybdenum ABC transporter ATP-binding protein [Sinobacterium caligoides]ROS01939.1 molybdate transport system ATP-binding protein [Sinobacterium caligoides]